MIHLIIALMIVAPGVPPSQGCGDGQSCQGVPWLPLALPALASPTPFATMMATATTASGSVLPTATGLPLDAFNSQLATFQAIAGSTEEAIAEIMPTLSSAEMDDSAGVFMNYMAGLPGLHFGVFQPLYTFMLGSAIGTITTSMLVIMLPLIVKTFGFFRKLVQLILDFIPG